MKVVRNTEDQLVLSAVPWIMGLILCGLFILIINFGLTSFFEGNSTDAFWGLVGIPAFLAIFIVVFIRRDDLMLDRRRNLVELRHSTFRGRTRVQHELEHLERAIVQTSRNSKGSETHRIAIILSGGMDAGTHPITPIYAGGRAAKRGAAAINAWLAMDVDSPRTQA